MVVGNDELSKRAKFVLVAWCGPDVKVMRRGKLSVHISEVKKVFKNFAIEISAESVDDLKEATVTLKLQVYYTNIRKPWVPTMTDKHQAIKRAINKLENQ